MPQTNPRTRRPWLPRLVLLLAAAAVVLAVSCAASSPDASDDVASPPPDSVTTTTTVWTEDHERRVSGRFLACEVAKDLLTYVDDLASREPGVPTVDDRAGLAQTAIDLVVLADGTDLGVDSRFYVWALMDPYSGLNPEFYADAIATTCAAAKDLPEMLDDATMITVE